MTDSKLLPCPFCGADGEDLELDDIWPCNLTIECLACSSYGPIKKDHDKGETAIEAWNTRPTNNLQQYREALEEIIDVGVKNLEHPNIGLEAVIYYCKLALQGLKGDK